MSNGTLKLSTGTATDLASPCIGNALSALGLTGPTGNAAASMRPRCGRRRYQRQDLDLHLFQRRHAGQYHLRRRFRRTVKTLDQLNAALQANNMQATVDGTGKLTITINNDFASSTLGSVPAVV